MSENRCARIEGVLMERITASSPLTKTVAQASALRVSLTLASEPTLQAQITSALTKTLVMDSRIDVEEV